MSKQDSKVLGHFKRWGGDSYQNIARCTGMPNASVRRSIQSLIHQGFCISYAAHNGIYAFQEDNK